MRLFQTILPAFRLLVSALLLGLLTTSAAHAQVTDSLLATLDTAPEPTQLLPDRMIFTQRMFWGKKGLLRVIGMAPLTDAGREKELHLRRSMLVTHQVLGYVTLAGMLAQGIVGARLYSGHREELGLHSGIAAGVNVAYFTTAAMSLLAPPPLLSRRVKGLNSMKLHRGLAVVHFSAMIATNLLAGQSTKQYHRAAAYTAFGSFATAVIVMKF
ncbi:MAG: hypothetical protein H7330_07015 [Hymenobacteraceae bacterium]|nr:hypothetical protein [Hymenobacteraceae bacterium]